MHGPFTEATKLAILRSIDKYDRLGEQGVHDLLTHGRRDESGAWSPGAGLSNGQADLVCYFITSAKDSTSNKETLARIARFFVIMAMPKDDLDQLSAELERAGLIDES